MEAILIIEIRDVPHEESYTKTSWIEGQHPNMTNDKFHFQLHMYERLNLFSNISKANGPKKDMAIKG